MSNRLAAYLTRSAPRYTSYPTAPHFSDAVTAEDYTGWLDRLDPAETISLYLHVPYCQQACWYCGCNMKLASRPEPVADYARTLRRELALMAEHLPERMTLSHLHWGGGTPTSLTPDDLERTMDQVRTTFEIAPEAELAIESDPRTLTDEMTQGIGRLGFNRASFGVQEFDPKVQATINRIQPPGMVARAVEGLRAAGVCSINFDLIYGLPHQTVDNLLTTIDLCADMRPDRIALFGYAHVPWMAKKQRMIPEEALPGANERLAQVGAAEAALENHGYRPIGLDHFALPEDDLALAAERGALRRNFQGYTTDNATALLGVGATAIGRTPSGYVQNITETGAWARAIEAGRLPIARGHAFSLQDRLFGDVIEALMCQGQANLSRIGQAHNQPAGWADDARLRLEDMIQDGLVDWTDDHLTVLPEGQALVRLVASGFDAYLPQQMAKHSVAV